MAEVETFVTLDESLPPDLKVKTDTVSRVVISGIGCRFPGGGNSTESFWEFLIRGGDAVGQNLDSRWDVGGCFSEEIGVPGKMYTKSAATLDEVALFDADFFEISPREAKGMDPQQRMLLEVVWQAVEDSGVSLSELQKKRVGVYVGLGTDDYSNRLLSCGRLDAITPYNSLGTTRSVSAGRLAYFLKLSGPVIQLDTACSSSLVATHTACEDIKSDRVDVAIVAGVNLLLSPQSFVACSQLRALSPTGRCKSFDDSADGYVRGEGCGAVVLMSETISKNCDSTKYAYIRGSAVNHDGRSNGLTAPNINAQKKLIRDALSAAKVDASQVSYVESHGTGTPLGDPIELKAIASSYCQKPRQKMWIGALKTNIGHLEAAAGIAGLIKTALVVKHKLVPPNLHFNNPNSRVDWSSLPVAIPTEATRIATLNEPAFGGVSSFGLSGTNAHVILESVTDSNVTPLVNKSAFLVPLSAQTEQALSELCIKYQHQFSHLSYNGVDKLSYSAQVARDHHSIRTSVLVTPESDFPALLKHVSTSFSKAKPNRLRIGFLYSGQGAQYAKMGKSLYQNNQIFRNAIEVCEALFLKLLNRSITEIMWDENNTQLNDTRYTQPCLFSFEYAMTQLWKSLGVVADVAVGHSLGEISAAVAANVFTLPDAVKMVYARSHLMATKSSPGSMLAVLSDLRTVEDIVAHCKDEVSIAAYNSNSNYVLSGEHGAIDEAQKYAKSKSIACVKLPVSCGFHSQLMEPMLDRFRSVMERISLQRPSFSIVSNISASLESKAFCDPEYWVRQIRQPVLFEQSLKYLDDYELDALIEIGPGSSLISFAKSVDNPNTRLKYLPSTRKTSDEYAVFLNTVSELYHSGCELNWSSLWSGAQPNKLNLPNYPFQRQYYWEDLDTGATDMTLDQQIQRIEQMSESEIDQFIGSFTQ